MTWLDKLTKSAEWGELAAIAALAILLFNAAKYVVVLLHQSQKTRQGAIIRHLVSIVIVSEPEDNVLLSYHTYFKKAFVTRFTFGRWLPYKEIPVSGSSGVYVVNKNDLLRNCKSIRSSYNFALEIPNVDAAKEKYFARIASNGYIITGRGRVNQSDEKRWLIFFVHPDEPYHVDSGFTWELKNSFF